MGRSSPTAFAGRETLESKEVEVNLRAFETA